MLSQLRAYKIFCNPMNIEEAAKFLIKKKEAESNKNYGCSYVKPNSSYAIGPIKVIFVGVMYSYPVKSLIYFAWPCAEYRFLMIIIFSS